MKRKMLSTTVYLTVEQNERLHELQRATKVPIAEFIREGIDIVLKKNRAKLGPNALDIFDAFRDGAK